LQPKGLVLFRVCVKETDLQVHAVSDLTTETRDSVLRYRGHLENYIDTWPDFAVALTPWPMPGAAPAIVRQMVSAGSKAGVGPMAAVAGAIAQSVGRDLLNLTPQVVVENGGDIFIKTDEPVTVGIYAGRSPLSFRIGLRVDSNRGCRGVCTSSGTVGHSLSRGKADAVCVVSADCALADAAATSIGNRVRRAQDVPDAVAFGRRIDGVRGLLVIIGDRLGLWGELEVIPLKGKKG
jgi:ApbE superfamily uncharacterized protein (UPF0280 family)